MNPKNGCIILISAFLFISPSMQPAIEWHTRISKPFSIEYPCKIECMKSGYVAIVETQNILTGKSGTLIVKLNENGRKEWEKFYGGGHASLLALNETLVILLPYGGKVCLIKMNENGNEIWNHTINFSCNFSRARSIIKIGKNYIFSLENMEKSILVKIDENGTIEWERIYNGSASIVKTGNGYVIVDDFAYLKNYTVIEKYDFGDNIQWKKKINGTSYNVFPAIDGFLLEHGYGGRAWIKFDENGRQQWNKTFEKGIGISSCSVDNGSYLMAGTKIREPFPKEEGILIKIDENGNEIWRKTYFMPRYNLGGVFLIYGVGFVDAKECENGVIIIAYRDAEPNALFVYFPPLFIFLIWLSFIKTDAFVVKLYIPV
ncbi:MAG: hypothetical protein J7K47_00250 [Thermoplasmata archaeon]|nr:hypothetical protein [Thermoplasmata archaeon]